MSRVAMRRVLPIVAASLTAALMLFDQIRSAEWESAQALLKYEQLTHKQAEGAVTWDPIYIAGRLPQVSAASILLAAVGTPGGVLACPLIILAGLVHKSLANWAWLAGIAFFWHLLGGGFDRVCEGRGTNAVFVGVLLMWTLLGCGSLFRWFSKTTKVAPVQLGITPHSSDRE